MRHRYYLEYFFDEAIRRIPYFIKDVYNRKRLHSFLGYRSHGSFNLLARIKHCNKFLDSEDTSMIRIYWTLTNGFFALIF